MFGIGVQEVRRTTKTFNVKGRLERHQRIVERTYAVCCPGGPANQMQPKILDSLMEGDVSDDLYQFRQKRGVTQTRGVFTAATNEAEKG